MGKVGGSSSTDGVNAEFPAFAGMSGPVKPGLKGSGSGPIPVRLDWTELFFSSAGRLGRGVFLGATAAAICALTLYDQLGWPLHMALGWIVLPMLFFICACLVSKRFHDFGRSGWRAAPVLLAFCLAWPHPHGLVGLSAVLVLAWSAIELGVTAGDDGFNRFGARVRLG